MRHHPYKLYGAALLAVVVGLVSIIMATFIGVVLGALAGYFGKTWDTVIMRTADVFFAFPLLIGPVVLGTLELYRVARGLLDESQVSATAQSADELGRTILDLSEPSGFGEVGGPRTFVHQAAGMVMLQIDGTIDEAMAYLRARAFVDGVSLVDLSAEVVRGDRHFGKDET